MPGFWMTRENKPQHKCVHRWKQNCTDTCISRKEEGSTEKTMGRQNVYAIFKEENNFGRIINCHTGNTRTVPQSGRGVLGFTGCVTHWLQYRREVNIAKKQQQKNQEEKKKGVWSTVGETRTVRQSGRGVLGLHWVCNTLAAVQTWSKHMRKTKEKKKIIIRLVNGSAKNTI